MTLHEFLVALQLRSQNERVAVVRTTSMEYLRLIGTLDVTDDGKVHVFTPNSNGRFGDVEAVWKVLGVPST